MNKSFIIRILFLLLTVNGNLLSIHAQYHTDKAYYLNIIDSLEHRITYLEAQLPRLQESRNLQFHNTKRELDHVVFQKAYYEYLGEEELDNARSLTEKRLERAEYRNDGLSIDFYNRFKKHIYDQIKFQRMYYQTLFEKEKTFRKSFDAYLKEGTLESYLHAKRMTELSIKYAKENQLIETEKYLHRYHIYIQAVIFDHDSPFDLEKLSKNPDAFLKVFMPLVSSDSLTQIKQAEELLEQCHSYVSSLNNNFDTLLYKKNRLLVASALSDYYDRVGNNITEGNSDQMILARLDSLNLPGVYKWHDFIVVINEFTPKYTSPNLKKGEAIMESDKKLFSYIKRQKLAKMNSGYKVYGTKFLPFKKDNNLEEFVYNASTKKWQYMICYETIENSEFTAQVRKYMPPMVFVHEGE
ncbi:MAG: hypothetical protein JXB00_19155 [Bacteroidales bacterium]|nr:hypothetical protein [Bacteroidales bacterium]